MPELRESFSQKMWRLRGVPSLHCVLPLGVRHLFERSNSQSLFSEEPVRRLKLSGNCPSLKPDKIAKTARDRNFDSAATSKKLDELRISEGRYTPERSVPHGVFGCVVEKRVMDSMSSRHQWCAVKRKSR
eukprot:4160962-Amphidinium_carterae.1